MGGSAAGISCEGGAGSRSRSCRAVRGPDGTGCAVLAALLLWRCLGLTEPRSVCHPCALHAALWANFKAWGKCIKAGLELDAADTQQCTVLTKQGSRLCFLAPCRVIWMHCVRGACSTAMSVFGRAPASGACAANVCCALHQASGRHAKGVSTGCLAESKTRLSSVCLHGAVRKLAWMLRL